MELEDLKEGMILDSIYNDILKKDSKYRCSKIINDDNLFYHAKKI